MVAQLYPPSLGSLFVSFCDSQGYDGGILTCLHTGRIYVISWLIDTFLGSGRETNNETTSAVRQKILISKNIRSLLGNGSATITHATIEVPSETGFSTMVRTEEL
jgi:hypothetical protein